MKYDKECAQDQYPYDVVCASKDEDLRLVLPPKRAGSRARAFHNEFGSMTVSYCSMCPSALSCDFGVRISLVGVNLKRLQ